MRKDEPGPVFRQCSLSAPRVSVLGVPKPKATLGLQGWMDNDETQISALKECLKWFIRTYLPA